MIEIVWEFVVKEEFQGRFELAYGPGGAWSALLGRCEGYRGTTLLRDENSPLRYLTVDMWDSVEQRDRMLAEHAGQYSELDAAFADWTEKETELGVFRLRTEATVRPVKSARRTAGSAVL